MRVVFDVADGLSLLEEMEGGDSRRANAGGTCHCQLRRSLEMGFERIGDWAIIALTFWHDPIYR